MKTSTTSTTKAPKNNDEYPNNDNGQRRNGNTSISRMRPLRGQLIESLHILLTADNGQDRFGSIVNALRQMPLFKIREHNVLIDSLGINIRQYPFKPLPHFNPNFTLIGRDQK